jgi:carboxyl-terminal processing protease
MAPDDPTPRPEEYHEPLHEPVHRLAEPPGYIATTGPVTVAPDRPRRGGAVLGVALALVAILGGSGLFLSGYTLGQRQVSEPGTPASDEEAFRPFWDAYQSIRDRYALGPVDRTKLVDGAIRGMVEAIGDPYSSYLSSDEFRQTLQDISGEFEGIGAEIGTVDAKGNTVDCAKFAADCRLTIVAPIDGSPAQKAGLQPGDVVVEIDGKSLDGLTPDEARDRIRGKKGTTVDLLIQREGRTDFTVTITRDVIQRREVITKELSDGKVFYIRLTGFSENGANEFTKELKAEIDKGVKKVVVDLRGNPGGFITAAKEVASDFIGSGPVFWQEDAKGNLTPTNADPGGPATDPKIQVAVLIDRGSASASEIVAGALQDTKRATLVGETSYGKGTVQEWLELGEAGGVKLTIAKWLTPDKRWIHKVGLVPDVPVEVPSDTPPGKDPVLDKALEVLGASSASAAMLLKAA